jgi:hypothetical protein
MGFVRNLLAVLVFAAIAVLATGGYLTRGARAEGQGDDGHPGGAQWVHLSDKGPGAPRSSGSIAYDDAPVYEPYVAQISLAAEVRHVSRWFNAVSVSATVDQLDKLRDMPFVTSIETRGVLQRLG